jgi:hypothetical protein
MAACSIAQDAIRLLVKVHSSTSVATFSKIVKALSSIMGFLASA